MNTRGKHIAAFDLIRSSAIFIVFIHHFITKEGFGPIVRSITPGVGLIAMSLLGFISAALLSRKMDDYGAFLLRRLSRIYIPLTLCLTTILLLYARVTEVDITQHTLLHYLGLTAFFQLFGVTSEVHFSGGLWFITTIVFLYLCMPMLGTLFSHPNRTLHLLLCGAVFSTLDFVMYGHANILNVVTGFAVGIYLQKAGKFQSILNLSPRIYVPAAIVILIINVLSAYEFFPFYVHSFLYLIYPFVFVPLLFRMAAYIPETVMKPISLFSSVSYEFYILHFYFLNDKLHADIASADTMAARIIVAFCITLVFSIVLSQIAMILRKKLDAYLFGDSFAHGVIRLAVKNS